MSLQIIESAKDQSVNFILTEKFPGMIEARYVRRKNFYVVAYLSSQTGCIQACRMCHLTSTGQTKLADVTPEQFYEQARLVLDWYRTKQRASIVNFNFMARGEALMNHHLLTDSDAILSELNKLAFERNLIPQLIISTIMPKTLRGKTLREIFPGVKPEIYYSIYSVKEKFRKKWLPKSLPVAESLQMLVDWQKDTRKIPKIHFAFIKNENDSVDDITELCKTISDLNLRVDVNIVRYNPYSLKQGEESSQEVINRNVKLMRKLLKDSFVKVIKPVGPDVYASCGMFVK